MTDLRQYTVLHFSDRLQGLCKSLGLYTERIGLGNFAPVFLQGSLASLHGSSFESRCEIQRIERCQAVSTSVLTCVSLLSFDNLSKQNCALFLQVRNDRWYSKGLQSRLICKDLLPWHDSFLKISITLLPTPPKG